MLLPILNCCPLCLCTFFFLLYHSHMGVDLLPGQPVGAYQPFWKPSPSLPKLPLYWWLPSLLEWEHTPKLSALQPTGSPVSSVFYQVLLTCAFFSKFTSLSHFISTSFTYNRFPFWIKSTHEEFMFVFFFNIKKIKFKRRVTPQCVQGMVGADTPSPHTLC